MFATMESRRLRMLQLTSLSARACGREKDLARLPRSSVFFSGFIANGKFVLCCSNFSSHKSGVFPAQKPSCPPKSLSAVQPQSPSVTSVTSVRCSPQWVSFPPRNKLSTKEPSTVQSQSPLCDLRDLCAMLSPMGFFPAQNPSCPPKSLPQLNLNPPL
jgi:hypothetical protein